MKGPVNGASNRGGNGYQDERNIHSILLFELGYMKYCAYYRILHVNYYALILLKLISLFNLIISYEIDEIDVHVLQLSAFISFLRRDVITRNFFCV